MRVQSVDLTLRRRRENDFQQSALSRLGALGPDGLQNQFCRNAFRRIGKKFFVARYDLVAKPAFDALIAIKESQHAFPHNLVW